MINHIFQEVQWQKHSERWKIAESKWQSLKNSNPWSKRNRYWHKRDHHGKKKTLMTIFFKGVYQRSHGKNWASTTEKKNPAKVDIETNNNIMFFLCLFHTEGRDIADLHYRIFSMRDIAPEGNVTCKLYRIHMRQQPLNIRQTTCLLLAVMWASRASH